jgi:hypothetical protein
MVYFVLLFSPEVQLLLFANVQLPALSMLIALIKALLTVCTTLSVERVTGLENDADKIIWINVRARSQTFLLCKANRPKWTDSEYSTRLSHAIGMGYQVNDNIVILGDSNSDLLIANNNTLIETIMMFNLVNIISKTTRITDHSNTLLDPIIISAKPVTRSTDISINEKPTTWVITILSDEGF